MAQRVLDWPEFGRETEDLYTKISITGYRPDVIVGIVRGGIIPARMLATQFDVNDMYCLTIRKVAGERVVFSEILEDLTGKEALLVEDALESGKSLAAGKEYLESKGARVFTAALYVMPDSEIKSDIYLDEVGEIPKFPWEK